MKNDFLLNLSVNISKQGKRLVAYSPALDISTSGKNLKDAQKKFAEIATIFFEELQEAGTTEDVLTELGWHKKQNSWNPPRVTSTQVGIRIPVFA